MRITSTLLALLAFMGAGILRAQTSDEDDGRYIEASFDVMAPTIDTFANNFSVLTGAPVEFDLAMDVYMPEGDTATNRAAVVIFPTGNFLPPFINQGVYGSRKDSANVYLAQQLAARGFVAIVADYRQGWLPTAESQVRRTETLLQAAYRGGQDAKALARYLRKTIAEDGNPYGIDEDRFVFWGLGTGGYVTLTHAFLDNIDEIRTNNQFYDQDGNLLINVARDGNVEGTQAGVLNKVNTPGYSSAVALTVNAGGALGDTTWIGTGDNYTDGLVGFHRVEDPNAPFNIGTVIVPTTEQSVITDVAGSHGAVRIANREGINDEFENINSTDIDDKFSDLSEELNELNATYQEMKLGDTDFPLSYDNLFPFIGDGGHWNWADEATARAIIGQINIARPTANLDADLIISREKEGNPNFDDPAAAKRVIDTMIAYFIPRAYVALNLGTVSTEFVTPASVSLQLFPNPAAAGFTVRVSEQHLIRQIDLYDINGRNVRRITGIDQTSRFVERGSLPRGQYIVRLQVDEGVTARLINLR